MKRISQTWKQKKSSERSHNVLKESANVREQPNHDKENQGISKVKKISTSLASQGTSFNLSFGFDFDAAVLSEVDKLEHDFLQEPAPKSSMVTPTDTFRGRSTPQIQRQAVTPHLSSSSNGVAGRFGQHTRGRISTPIEDTEHMLLFLPAHSPVFSPVTSAVGKFENGNDSSRTHRSELYENPTSQTSKSQLSTRLSQSHSRSILEVDASSSGDPLGLSSWGLPPAVLRQYNELGITHMFEWQAECLRTGKVLSGGNLVYSAPTSAGKTMVAELLMLKRVLETKRKALFILPFISVAREKMFYLQRLFQEAGVRVEGYMGSHAPAGGFASVDIAVCTIEKANSLLNRLLEESKAQSSLGIVVVDEMHMIGDSHRGYLLELFLTKIRYIAGCNSGNGRNSNEADNDSAPAIQIVGMSATLLNLDMLAKWLSADLYFTDYRPVPLTEMVKISSTLYDVNMKKIRDISVGARAVHGDEDHVIPLCKETIADGCAVLVFCPTKNWCEKLAESIAKHFAEIGNMALQDGCNKDAGFVRASTLLTFDYPALKEVIEQLKRTQVGLDSVLSRTVPHAVAFHHAGLTFDERDIIEGAFRQGSIRVLVATSTLSSGVNLPARRVIIRTPIFHGKLVDSLVYKQMAGRAGRKGVDALGESILMCKPAERQKAASLLSSRLKAVQSCLLGKGENSGIKRALLEVIASGVVTRPQDVERYAACTFFASSSLQDEASDTDSVINKTVQFLVENEFVRLQRCDDRKGDENTETDRGGATDQQKYAPTQLGVATLSSALSPDEALIVFAEVQKARKCFVLESELHVIYQVTPIYIQDQWPNIDWYQYLRIWERLPSNMRRVADLVGIEEAFLARAVRGRILTRTDQQRQSLAAHRKFYAALALQDLVHEVPLHVVARRYGASRGMLQSLQSSASTFAGMVTVFCEKLGWTNMALLLSQFQSRLSFGVERELCDLVRISLLNAARARMLYNAGYHTIASLAAAPESGIENILHNAAPFVSGLKRGEETETEVRERSEARVIWVAGRRGLTEGAAAKLIVSEAKQLLQADVAELGIQWKPPEVNQNHDGRRDMSAVNVSSASVDNQAAASVQPVTALQVPSVNIQEASLDSRLSRSKTETCSLAGRVHSHTNRAMSEHGKDGACNLQESTDPPRCQGQVAGLTTPENNQTVTTGVTLTKPSPRSSPLREVCTNRGGFESKKKCGVNTNQPALATEMDSNRISVPDSEAYHPPVRGPVEKETNSFPEKQPLVAGGKSVSPPDNLLRSRNKRRSPTVEMSESPIKGPPKEKLQKRDKPEVLVVVESPSLLEISGSLFATAEASSDSKLLNEDVQCTSVELYSEPFEGEEVAVPEKPSQVVQNDNDVMPESQQLAGCSLSDSCLMECDVMLGAAVETSSKPPRNELLQNSCDLEEELYLKTPGVCPVRPSGAFGNQDDIVGEYDTQPRVPCTGEFHADRGFNFPSSFASPVLQPPKCAVTEDLCSASVADSFSLHLSCSESYMDSDLSRSTLAMVELMEREAKVEHSDNDMKRNLSRKGKDDVGQAPSDRTPCEVKFTQIKNSKNSSSSSNRSPANKITHNGRYTSKVVMNEAETSTNVNETPESNVVPCTPPRGKDSLQADFKTRTSATPLSSRKRHSPRRCPPSNTPDGGLVIIDVTGHEQVFDMFLKEWRSQTRFSLAVACERFLGDVPRIGGRFSNAPTSEGTSRGLKVEGQDQVVVGVAVSWGDKDAYYVSLREHEQSTPSQPDDSQSESAVDANLTLTRRLDAMRSVLQSLTERQRHMVCFDVKEHFKTFACSAGISLSGPAEDPKVASWLLDPGAKEKNLHQLVGQHLPEDAPLLEGSGGGFGTGGLALAYQCRQSGRVRACVESVLVLGLMKKLRFLLEAEELVLAYTKVEMPSALCLARMELNGVGFSDTESEHLKNILQAKLRTLEEEAYRLANHSFSLTSREDVAQVLFVELKLPHDGNTDDASVPKRKTLGVTRRGTTRVTKQLSTNKEVLERLKPMHPLPGLIMEWRRINSALTKVVFPLQKEKCLSASLKMSRIHSMSQTHTATGRVSFAEPNLQNVPRDFDIALPTTVAESPPPGAWDERASSKRGRRHVSRQSLANTKSAPSSTAAVAPNYSVSMRNAFVPFKNGVLLAADYSQLELRLIAHLADDERLRRILNAGGDVFRTIAAELYRTPADSVKDNQRQRAKQVCYGIIYGIGAKALGEQLGLTEDEAAVFIDKFTSRYVGVKTYLKETVLQCKKQGFVKTITGRKRFLPAINSTNVHAQSQAARQAVNTTVQGSAADLVKTAMVMVDKRLIEDFPSCVLTHRHRPPDLLDRKGKSRGRRSRVDVPPPVGGYFVLQLHDELIFEVSATDLRHVAEIVKTEMENALKLSVVLPVKMKAGPSWGNMAEFEL